LGLVGEFLPQDGYVGWRLDADANSATLNGGYLECDAEIGENDFFVEAARENEHVRLLSLRYREKHSLVVERGSFHDRG
jgi:hypothetical protein